MSLVDNERIKSFLIDYEKQRNNKYTKEQTTHLLSKTAEEFDIIVDSIRVSKNIVRTNIIYEDETIGYLNGVRPSSTSKEAVILSKNSSTMKEYLKLLNINYEDSKQNHLFNLRISIVEGAYTAASLIIPPFVIGNNKDTIEELINKKNETRQTSAYFRSALISIDENIEDTLKNEGLHKDSILSANEVFLLKDEPIIKNGAETLDVTNLLSTELIQKANDTIASIPGLYTASLDITTNDYLDLDNIGFKSIIVSPNPQIHYLPYKGQPKKIYTQYIHSLIAEYKKYNNIKLNKEEEFVSEALSEFQKSKEHYLRKLSELNLEVLGLNENLKEKIKMIQRNQLIESSRKSRDKVKRNLVVDESIFKPSENNKEIKVTKFNVLRLVKSRKDSTLMADKALRNEIIPFPSFDSVLFDSNYFYTDKSKTYGASYQLYIQSLRIAAVLLLKYEKSKNIRYLYKAEELIYSWITYVSEGTEEPMVWYDHPTSNRVQVLIHYLYLIKDTKEEIDYSLFRSILNKHGEVLGNDDIYINNNHGLMMDKSLMLLGNVLDDENFFVKGYYRSIDTFWYSFSSKGTHLENSPNYHNMVVRMYEQLQKYLVNNNQSYNETILNNLKLANNYLNIIMKPDSMLPPIGDSDHTLWKANKSYENFYDEEAGIAVLQFNDIKSFYVNFICGYSSRTHKHKDDLSINLNYNGEDFITDSGKYNYNGKDPIRNYIISPAAHSSFQLKKFNYDIKHSNRFNRKITMNGFNFTDNVSLVKGMHGDYKDTDIVLNREVIQINKLPIVILYDFIENEDGNKYNFIQNFNLSDNIEAKYSRKLCRLNGQKENLIIKQLLKTDKPEVILGDEKTPIAVNATGFSKVIETSQVKYHKSTAKRDVFLTAIYDDSIINEVKLLNLDQTLELKIDGNIYNINI